MIKLLKLENAKKNILGMDIINVTTSFLYRIWDHPSSFFGNILAISITSWKNLIPWPMSSIPPFFSKKSPVCILSHSLLWSCPRSCLHQCLTHSLIFASDIPLITISDHWLLFITLMYSDTLTPTIIQTITTSYLLTQPFFTLKYPSSGISVTYPR